MARDKAYWDGLVVAVNALTGILKYKPRSMRTGYSLNPGSILNAYREGDLTFNQALKALKYLNKRKNH